MTDEDDRDSARREDLLLTCPSCDRPIDPEGHCRCSESIA